MNATRTQIEAATKSEGARLAAARLLLEWVEQQERRDACRQSETARRDPLALREVAA